MARKRTQGLRRRAQRDIRSAYRPAFRDLESQKREARDLYEEGVTEAGDIHERTNNMLGDLMPNWKDATANISSDYISQLGSLGGVLGLSPANSGEDQMSQQLLGGIGAGTLGNLAEGQQRNLAYMQSTKRQALFDRNVTEKNYLEDFQDIERELSQTRFDMKQDIATQVMARFDELRQQRFERRMAQKEYELRKTIAEKQESRADKESRTQRKATNYVVKQEKKELDKEELKNLINRLEKRKTGVKQDIAELRKTYPALHQRNGVWGYEHPNGAFVPVPEMKELVAKKRRIKGNVSDAQKKRRKL